MGSVLATREADVDHGELMFRRLLEDLPTGAYICDAEGLITYYNRHAVQVWGREPRLNDPIDRFCGSFKLLSAEGLAIAHDQCWMALALRNGRAYNGCEIVVERPDGEQRTVLAHATPIHDDAGDMVGAVNVLVDITERKNIERALQASEERNLELEHFASVASHDLQEPLRMISSFVQLLRRRYGDQLDDTARDYIDYAVDGTQRMHRLIQDLLAYSRVGTNSRSFEPVEMSAVLETVLKDLREVIEESGAVVEAEDLPTVIADGTQTRQLFQNLLSNAIKFRTPGTPPCVRIRADKEPAGAPGPWKFSVSDNGIGMDTRYAGRIFEVFQRLHAGSDYKGTGIGLAICKRIVERHGGSIWVDSEPGRGSTFYFTLSS